jgi:alanine racemase
VLTLEEAAKLRLMGVEQPFMLLEGIFGADEIAACAELDLWPVLHHAASSTGCNSSRRQTIQVFSSSQRHASAGFLLPIMRPRRAGERLSE